MFFIAMLIYGSVGIFRRSIPLSSSFIAFFRGVCGAAVLVGYAFIRKIRIFTHVPGKTLFWLILSGAMMGINWMMLFEAYNYTTVSVATLCYYMQPMFLILLSPIFLREKITRLKLICAGIAFLGMILVSGAIGTPTYEKDLRGILYGLGAAVFYTFVVILNKKNPDVNTYLKTVIQLLSASAVLLPYVLKSTSAPDAWDLSAKTVILLVMIGVIHTGIAYTLYFGSLDGLKGQTVALMSYVDPVSALLLSALIFPDEALTLSGALGAVLIIGAAIISEKKDGFDGNT